MKIFILFLSTLVLSPTLKAQGLYEYLDRKQEEKNKNRWTLADWMATKERNGWMDQWLAMNTAPTKMDFSLGAEIGNLTPTTDTVQASRKDINGASLELNFNIIGLEGQYKKSKDRYTSRTGIFNLRILGSTNQSTFIAVQYGLYLLNDNSYGKYDYEFLGVYANFYFLPWFGAQGGYRNYSQAKSDSLAVTSKGHRLDAGAFIEMGPLRFYGNYFRENLSFSGNSLTGGKDQREEKGITYGLKLFF